MNRAVKSEHKLDVRLQRNECCSTVILPTSARYMKTPEEKGQKEQLSSRNESNSEA